MFQIFLALTALLSVAAPVPASPVQAGRFEELPSTNGVVVAAPHGGFDRYTEDIARQTALAMGAGYLLACGFRTFEHPWNVNRPTEGARLAVDDEARTPAAQAVYEAYASRVRRLAPRLYVEIHGNNRPESAGWIETATVNISREEAATFQADFRRRVAALDASYPRFDLHIEPLDELHYRAASTKRQGVFRLVPRVLHLELPSGMRLDARVRSRYAWTIAQSLESLTRHNH